jgi:hypothetical protein
MLALGALQSWLLIGVVAGVLWAFWGVLGITFDMLERWHEGRRRPASTPWQRYAARTWPDQPPAEDGGKPRKEKELSESS